MLGSICIEGGRGNETDCRCPCFSRGTREEREATTDREIPSHHLPGRRPPSPFSRHDQEAPPLRSPKPDGQMSRPESDLSLLGAGDVCASAAVECRVSSGRVRMTVPAVTVQHN